VTAATLPDGWTLRTPEEADLPRLIELRALDERPWVGDGEVDPVSVESVVIGQASWTRRQVVAVDESGTLRAWVIVQDRASGRAMVTLIVDREVEDPASVAAVLYAWAQGAAISLARLRGIPQTRLDASPFADDAAQKGWLADAGYTCRRTWLHMTRPVAKGEQVTTRPGVTVRIVRKHSNDIPVAQDLQTIHQVLEESFQDHFNSYRETFPEFLQRLREDPGHRWDHWWLAFVDDEDGEETEETEETEDGTAHRAHPAGALVSSVLPPDADGVRGSYVDYIGVNRRARGRGVAKALLSTVLADAAERGRNRVDLEVDADSPTRADELYTALGWRTDHVTESWFRDLSIPARA